MKKDILLLADSLEKCISVCLKYYGLDLCHYCSDPGLSWDAMLKMTGVTLEKASDPDKYMFFEQGMGSEVSYINKRYSDTMSQYLLYANFKWIKNIDKMEQKLMNIKSNSPNRHIP